MSLMVIQQYGTHNEYTIKFILWNVMGHILGMDILFYDWLIKSNNVTFK